MIIFSLLREVKRLDPTGLDEIESVENKNTVLTEFRAAGSNDFLSAHILSRQSSSNDEPEYQREDCLYANIR